jgi:leucyl aminopeptidase
MNFELKTLDLSGAASEKCDALIVLLNDAFKPGKDPLSTLVAHARKAGDLDPKPGKHLSMYRPAGAACSTAILAGIGDGSVQAVRKAITAAVGAVKGGKLKKLVICFASAPTQDAVRCAVTAVAEASYVFTTTKSKPEGRTIQRVVVGMSDATEFKNTFHHATAAVVGIEFAKEWANRPANHATPTLLAGAARALAKLPNIKCEVLGPKEVAKLAMGSFMAVAQGSDEPLRFIILHYEGAAKKEAPTVLVGKGITFDSGGISIKPAPEMDEMKFDMSGAASVLGVFRALAELKPEINVVGLIPASENLLSGQTIEILNTDAEGRLVLCDALTYAERFKPRAVVDIATLTGACMIALGGVRSGLFSTDDELAAALLAAGESSADLCWRMPLDDEYAEGLKSNFADVANVGGRPGGAITAAKFLQRFTSKYPWAHLDIAGIAWKGGAAKGASGRPVALLLDYLASVAKHK